ncbi:MAG: hypothetical protein KME20_28090 [Kaiparowitsia implicata GSE-PSE-MK54-09C]|jgi:hypothetical protein|nr:hypothetical protein [Kaiparowitsia implicata GSE-PSE-MK54-09C]
MQGTIDRLSEELSKRYFVYLESLLVELVAEGGALEFQCGFALRSDHKLRTCRYGVPAGEWATDAERDIIAAAVFEELEHFIDEAIAEQLQDAN